MSTTRVVPLPAGDFNTRVGLEIDTLRKRYRISQEILGQVIGVTQSHMGKMLKGNSPITLRQIEALAEYFGVQPFDLMSGDALRPRPDGGPGGGGVAWAPSGSNREPAD